MTVADIDKLETADADSESSGLTLDALFEVLERMPVPGGYRVEVVEGSIYMSPQRRVRWKIIRRIVRALEDEFGMDVEAFSDVRIDFPGDRNGFCPDVAKLCEGAEPDAGERWRHQDVEFVAAVISKGTGANDYGP